MGIESDQLVFDYLSRVGDLAQQRQMTSGARMTLVSELREEIGRQRSKSLGGEDSPAAVRRILRRIGTPDEVVDRAAVPAPRKDAAAVPDPVPGDRASADGDWWTTDDPPNLPGFVGGVELAEILRPPADEEEEERAPDADPDDDPDDGPDPTPEPRRIRRITLTNPLLLLAAALLVVGAVLGSLLALAGGWIIAYASRRLTPFESKLAVMGLPGVAAGAGAIWIWGRLEGRWGTPIAEGAEPLSAALSTTWPWVIRAAALTSALYLTWRSRRA
ncbi:hypothetical protein AB0C77_02840 [Streptomyces sp. NPDC048629]|uniref:hypothetical protein n=1 Tax=Streptomyces sp. NPDC048629 TaxID=3154824 RepID=UPI00342F977E